MAEAGGSGADRSLADERLLLERFHRTRDPALRDELVNRFMPLARNLANRYVGGSEPAEDLQQVASLGLVKAIDGFDPTLGHAFPSYAAPTILGELRRHFRDRSRSVHLTRGLQERIMLVERAMDALPTRLGHIPSPSEVAEHTELTLEETLEAMEAGRARRPYSLDAPSAGGDDDDGSRLEETLGDEDIGFEAVEYGDAVSRTLAQLPVREQRIIHLRFVEDRTQSEIAAELGISQMHVSRLLRAALEAIRSQVPSPRG